APQLARATHAARKNGRWFAFCHSGEPPPPVAHGSLAGDLRKMSEGMARVSHCRGRPCLPIWTDGTARVQSATAAGDREGSARKYASLGAARLRPGDDGLRDDASREPCARAGVAAGGGGGQELVSRRVAEPA